MNNDAAWAELLRGCAEVAEEQPSLVRRARGRELAVLSQLVAEALLRLSGDLHQPSDRARLTDAPPAEELRAYRKEGRSLRQLETDLGIPKSTLQRLLKEALCES